MTGVCRSRRRSVYARPRMEANKVCLPRSANPWSPSPRSRRLAQAPRALRGLAPCARAKLRCRHREVLAHSKQPAVAGDGRKCRTKCARSPGDAHGRIGCRLRSSNEKRVLTAWAGAGAIEDPSPPGVGDATLMDGRVRVGTHAPRGRVRCHLRTRRAAPSLICERYLSCGPDRLSLVPPHCLSLRPLSPSTVFSPCRPSFSPETAPGAHAMILSDPRPPRPLLSNVPLPKTYTLVPSRQPRLESFCTAWRASQP